MQSKQNNNSMQAEKDDRLKHDADAGNDGPPNETLREEEAIDPGNEHHHAGDNKGHASLSHNADAGSDSTGTTGSEPGDGENDDPDSSGEDG